MPGLSPEDQELVNAALSKYTAAVPPPVVPVQELAGQALAQPAHAAPTDQAMAMAALNRSGVPPEPMAPTPAPVAAPTAVAPVAPAAPAVAVPPRPHGKQTFQGALGELDDATATAEQAQQTYTNAQVDGLHAREQIAGDQTGQLEAERARREEMDRAYRENRERVQSEHEALQAKADSMQIKDTRSTGMKAMAIVGQAFAGLGDAFSRLGGNTNTDYAGAAIRMTREAVESDLNRQREEKKTAEGKADKKLSQLALAQDFFQDDRKGEEWYKANRDELYATQLEQAAAASGSQVKVAEGAKAAAELRLAAQQKKVSLLGQHEEQQMRSRLLGGAKAGAGASMGVQDILRMGDTNVPMTPKQRAEYNQLDKNRDGDQRAADQKKFREEQAAGKTAAAAAKGAGGKADTADQAKARMLFTSSERPAAALADRMKTGRFPATSASLAEKSGLLPDAWNKDAAAFAQEVEATGNDILRYESGASISTQETEGLVKRARSTDPDIRNAAIQRLLDKRNALGNAFTQRKPEGSVAAPTGGESRQPKTIQRATSAADLD